MSGYDIPKGLSRGPHEAPKGRRGTALAVSIDEPNNASSVHQHPIHGVTFEWKI